MHIGFLTPEYVMPGRFDGGLANYIRKVGLALTSRGHQVSVLVLSNQNARWQDDRIAVYEVKRVVVPQWLRVKRFRAVVAQVLSSRRLESVVWRIQRADPFDILQASSFEAPGYTLLRNGRLPLVCRVSSYTPLWRSAYGRRRSLSEYISDWLEIRQVLDADASFAPSGFLADTFARLEGHRPQVIRTPLDLQDISMDLSHFESHLAGTPYLLFFGTLSRIKGVDLLAQVIPTVLERHQGLAFVFVGRDDSLPGGQKVFDYVRSCCKSFERRLHYYAALPKSQLYPIVANALGVLMPSRVDNYPNACLEAQFLGVPVVGTYHSSLDEMIVPGETGFLAANDDPGSLASAIERLLSLSPAGRQRMRHNIKREIERVRSEDRVGQLICLYEETIATFGL